MVDVFSILISHALIALAVLRLVARDDLDSDSATDDKAAETRRPSRIRRRPSR